MSDSVINKLIELPSQSSRVSISIEVGMRQSGTITFNVSGMPIVQEQGKLVHTVANSDDLNRKSFDFNIVCTDVNPDSNNLVVTVTLSGVTNEGPWTLEQEVEAGGAYQFFGKLNFYKR